jgi:hypothetical protein
MRSNEKDIRWGIRFKGRTVRELAKISGWDNSNNIDIYSQL